MGGAKASLFFIKIAKTVGSFLSYVGLGGGKYGFAHQNTGKDNVKIIGSHLLHSSSISHDSFYAQPWT